VKFVINSIFSKDMFLISNVTVVEYYSNTIPKDLIVDLLYGAKCDSAGSLELTLKPNLELIQEGPYLLPPIRWLESFEPCDEFTLICTVSEFQDSPELLQKGDDDNASVRTG
jgi:hypothetical protein